MLYDPNWKPPAEIKLEPWQEILLKAVDILEEKGWCQQAIQNSRGEHCMYGAMAAGYAADDRDLFERLDIMCIVDLPFQFQIAVSRVNAVTDVGPFWFWNDMIGRTKEEVIAKLREAAYAV